MKEILLLVLMAISSAFSDDWEDFKLAHGKSYGTSQEELLRLKIYEANKKLIEEHNTKFMEGLASFEMGMNQFGDLTYEEFSEVILCLNESRLQKDIPTYTYIPPATLDKVPEEVDWRQQGAVTPVKNQAACGSCWAFSATGALEGQHFRKTGQLVSLSEQQLVDCSGIYGNHGCQGGMPDRAYKYIIANKGIATEQAYPYNGRDNMCQTEKGSDVIVTGIMKVPRDEESLSKAVSTVGPISICIHATDTFRFYKKGVFTDKSCSSTYINHAVLAVGYGSEDGQDFWLVKNSWGTSWGEQGYIRMARNRDNQCAVATVSRYPLV